jgi:hypothetical protein
MALTGYDVILLAWGAGWVISIPIVLSMVHRGITAEKQYNDRQALLINPVASHATQDVPRQIRAG